MRQRQKKCRESACGHTGVPSAAAALGWRTGVPSAAAALWWRTEPRTDNPRRGVSVSSRRGWGPAASGKKMVTFCSGYTRAQRRERVSERGGGPAGGEKMTHSKPVNRKGGPGEKHTERP